jgi:hypothetical protein
MTYDAAPDPRHKHRSLMGSALAAAMVMAVGMGFARFAYTGVYPVMVSEGLLTVHDGTLAASANYAGYLLGALLASRFLTHQAHRWVIVSMVMSVVCLVYIAFAPSLLQHKGYQQGAPILFAGVGVGIFVSSELIALVQSQDIASFGLWIALGLGSAVIAALALSKLDNTQVLVETDLNNDTQNHHIPFGAWSLIAAYGLAGFGYIITATYLPMLIGKSLGNVNPIHVWAIFGLGAAPSCYFWHKFHLHYGTHVALRVNLLTQAIGVVLPIVAPNAVGYIASALIVGGTFMGTVTIAMPAAKRVSHTINFNLIAIMTAAYGIGQIVGPLLASYLYAQSGTFTSSLIAAALGLVFSAALTVRIPTTD